MRGCGAVWGLGFGAASGGVGAEKKTKALGFRLQTRGVL